MVAIVVAAAVGVYIWSTATISKVTEGASVKPEYFSACINILGVKENKLYIRNCGSGVITNNTVAVCIGETKVEHSMNPPKIKEQEIAEITLHDIWRVPAGNHRLRVTSGGAVAEKYVRLRKVEEKNLCNPCGENEITINFELEHYPTSPPIPFVILTYSAEDLDGGFYLQVNGRKVIDSHEMRSDIPAHMGSQHDYNLPDNSINVYTFVVPGKYFYPGQNSLLFDRTMNDKVTWHWVKVHVIILELV